MRARRPSGPLRPAQPAAFPPPDPGHGRRRAGLSLLPALALLVGALGLFAAAPAQAQTTVWSAKLTVSSANRIFGCGPTVPVSCSVALTDNDFTYNGVTYTVTRVEYDDVPDILRVGFNVVPSGQFILHVGGVKLSTNDDLGVSNNGWSWDPYLIWPDGQQVSLKLTTPPPVVSFSTHTVFLPELAAHGLRGSKLFSVTVDPPLGPSGSFVHLRIKPESTATQDSDSSVTQRGDYKLFMPNVSGTTTTKELWLPPGQSTVRFGMTTVADRRTEGEEEVNLELVAIDNAPYTIGSNAELDVVISDESMEIPLNADPNRGITIQGPDTAKPRRATVAVSSSVSYSIKLNSAPSDNVTVTAYLDDDEGPFNLSGAGGKLRVSPASLTFTSTNWFTPQSFTVTPQGSDSVGKYTIIHGVTSLDSDYYYGGSFHGPGIRTHIVIYVTDPAAMESPGQPTPTGNRPLMELCAPHLPANAVSVAEVTGWRDAHPHDASHVLRWNKVLEGLGVDTGTNVSPLTVEESKVNEDRFMRTRWSRVTGTLDAIDACVAAVLMPGMLESVFGPPLAQPTQAAPAALHADLITQMNGWRNDPQHVSHKSHTDRWDRALLAFGEPVSDTSLTPMTDSEAQDLADTAWGERWVGVAAALKTVVTGTNSANTLNGTSSGELLVGLGGDDTLTGQGGNDELRGGDGDDDISGGGGADRFVFFSGETGANAITDFGAGDVIVLKGSGWSSVANIIASVQGVGSTGYRYTLATGLTVESTNNRSLGTEDFVTE